jgi:hypothetical protein
MLSGGSVTFVQAENPSANRQNAEVGLGVFYLDGICHVPVA